MLHILGKIPHTIAVACSGGIDSMVVIDFLLRGRKKVYVLHFHHGTTYADHALNFIRDFCTSRNLELVVGEISNQRNQEMSQEEFWRNERYTFFKSVMFHKDMPLITCHHLDDQVENWVFTSLHGNPRLIPYYREDCNVIRPFLTTSRKEIEDWCERKRVHYLEDPSNRDVKYARNRIRHNLMPEILKINPGIHKTVKKRVLTEFEALSEH